MSIQVMFFIINLLFKRVFLFSFGVLFLSGCSITPIEIPGSFERVKKIDKLSTMLEELNSTVDKIEARDLARSVILRSHQLSQTYKLVSPPLWHNTLVNIGVKKRGLCYEWTEDLLAYLHKKRYQSLEFHYVGANIDGYFEHNALSVSAKGVPFDNSILLDAWRDSGNLFFTKLKEDRKYRWRSRKDVYRLMFPHLKRWR